MLHDQYFNLAGFKKAIDYLSGDMFSSSETYERAVGVFDVNHYITIIGPPGSGKTLTAVQLADRKCGLSKLFFCQTVEEILDISEKRKGAYIVLDDWIDEYLYYPSKIGNAIDLLSSVYDNFVQSGDVYLILTVQEDNWNRLHGFLENCALFKRKCLLKIQPKKFTETEKENMIFCHFKHFNKVFSGEGQNKSSDSFAANLKKLKNEEMFSFPVMIDLICANERLERAQNLILRDGFSNILKESMNIWFQDTYDNAYKSVCILVFAAFLGGKVALSDFKSPITGPLFDKIYNEYKYSVFREEKNLAHDGFSDQLPEQEIEMLLRENKRLRSFLYKTSCRQNDSVYIFHHSSLFRFVLSCILEKKGELFFIENANVEVLIKICWIDAGIMVSSWEDSCQEPPLGSVILTLKALKTFAVRIHSEIEQGYTIPDWKNHIFMCDNIFKRFWENVHLAKSIQCQH